MVSRCQVWCPCPKEHAQCFFVLAVTINSCSSQFFHILWWPRSLPCHIKRLKAPAALPRGSQHFAGSWPAAWGAGLPKRPVGAKELCAMCFHLVVPFVSDSRCSYIVPEMGSPQMPNMEWLQTPGRVLEWHSLDLDGVSIWTSSEPSSART